jgi:transcriptional regulator with XRE-family HTH domain
VTETFGERLRREAVAKFGSVGKFADAIGMQRPQMTRYVGDRQRPEDETIIRFAEGLELPFAEVASWKHPVDVALNGHTDGFDAYEGEFVGWLRSQPRMRVELDEVRETRGEVVYRKYLQALWSAWESNFRATMAALRLGEGGDVT